MLDRACVLRRNLFIGSSTTVHSKFTFGAKAPILTASHQVASARSIPASDRIHKFSSAKPVFIYTVSLRGPRKLFAQQSHADRRLVRSAIVGGRIRTWFIPSRKWRTLRRPSCLPDGIGVPSARTEHYGSSPGGDNDVTREASSIFMESTPISLGGLTDNRMSSSVPDGSCSDRCSC